MTHRGSGRKSFGLAQEPSGKRASTSVALIDWSHAAGRTHFQDACWSLSLEAELVLVLHDAVLNARRRARVGGEPGPARGPGR